MSWKTSSSYRAFIMATDVPLPDQYRSAASAFWLARSLEWSSLASRARWLLITELCD